MKKYILTRKNGDIVMASDDNNIKFDENKFIVHELDLTEEEEENFKNNKYSRIKDKKIIFHNHVQKAIDIRDKINKAKTISELKDIILDLERRFIGEIVTNQLKYQISLGLQELFNEYGLNDLRYTLEDDGNGRISLTGLRNIDRYALKGILEK
jgi:hypothetical protein